MSDSNIKVGESNVFQYKDSWITFAQEHNATADLDAEQLTGSASYTLAAIHLSAGIPLPKSVKLDIKRAQGKFVADHFNGLRKLYESGTESSSWLPDILEQCRKFARIHSLGSDEIILNVITMTEKKGRKSTRNDKTPSKAVDKGTTDFNNSNIVHMQPRISHDLDDDIKI